MAALTKEQKDGLKFVGRVVIGITAFFVGDYLIDASDSARFIIGPLAPFAELIMCSGLGVAAFMYSKNL